MSSASIQRIVCQRHSTGLKNLRLDAGEMLDSFWIHIGGCSRTTQWRSVNTVRLTVSGEAALIEGSLIESFLMETPLFIEWHSSGGIRPHGSCTHYLSSYLIVQTMFTKGRCHSQPQCTLYYACYGVVYLVELHGSLNSTTARRAQTPDSWAKPSSGALKVLNRFQRFQRGF